MHFCKQNPRVWEKMPIEGAIHLQSHSIPLTILSNGNKSKFPLNAARHQNMPYVAPGWLPKTRMNMDPRMDGWTSTNLHALISEYVTYAILKLKVLTYS